MNNRIGGGYITFTYRYRKQILIASICVITIIAIIVFSIIYINKSKKHDTDNIIKETDLKEKKPTDNDEYFKVDIKGEINNPGIYKMKENSRVIDVIDSAGGLTEFADTSVINLSKKITDEMVIIIYSREQVSNFEKTKELENYLQKMCAENEEYSLKNDACIATNNVEKVSGKININTASIDELTTLTGIGESRAKDIIKYREDNGPFKSIEDIKNVSGIGDSTFDNIKENITT